MFQHVLQAEGKRACDLGYDKPSKKSLSFLAKHFGLVDYVPQTSNFVVYEDYFKHNAPVGNRRSETHLVYSSDPNSRPSRAMPFGTAARSTPQLSSSRPDSRSSQASQR